MSPFKATMVQKRNITIANAKLAHQMPQTRNSEDNGMLSQRTTNDLWKIQNRINPELYKTQKAGDVQRIQTSAKIEQQTNFVISPTSNNNPTRNFQSLEAPFKMANTMGTNLSLKRGSVPQSANTYMRSTIKSANGSLRRDPFEDKGETVINPQAIIYGKLLQKNQKNAKVPSLKVNNYVDLS